MEITNLSIGQALAIIINNSQNNHKDPLNLDENNQGYFRKIKTRYVDLSNKTVELEKIIASVPGERCPSGKPFLEHNTDFFIAFIILSENDNKDYNTTPKLIRHLNDCYWCFKNYNNFIREYYYTSQKFKGESENE